jgi:molybdenum cofactor cytidylyltransferase
MISAIIVSAGKSERMGSPKALLPIAGRTFLENILAAVEASVVSQVVVVLGHHREWIERSVPIPNIVFNPDYEHGMTTSIQAGIRALPADSEGALLFLVDHPVIEPSTIDILVQSFKPGQIILPTYHGRRGHPVLFSNAVLAEIVLLPASQGANQVVWRDPARVVEIPVRDRGILIDIDTPEQFEEFSS